MTNPYKPPTSALNTSSKSEEEIESIRQGQQLVLYAILMNFGVAILFKVNSWFGFLQILTLGVSIFGLVRMFQGMQTPMWARIPMIILMIFPWLNLLVLFPLNSRATKILVAAGYKVGFMGASKRSA